MRSHSTFNILMYSHDTYGLGHIRRTMAIAARLKSADTNVLILTGSPIAGRFAFPDHVDFVRIPGMIKKTNEEYLPLSIKINTRHALNIRKNIITATAKTFRPDLFIVDKEPFGLKKEVMPTLKWLRRCMPGTRTILGLRDIMDDAETIKKDWKKKGVYDVLDRLYNEIWIYGLQELYDPIKEYAIPEAISRKTCFTGYIPRRIPGKKAIRKLKKDIGIKNNEKLVVITIGGGGDGFAVMDKYLSMLETCPPDISFKSFLIMGPFMPRQERREIYRRARRIGAISSRFYNRMEEVQAAADLVISMGGYNTVCEILSQRTVSLIIPRETPRKEQLIRAQVLHKQHLVDYIPWSSVSTRLLREKVEALLKHPESYWEAIADFRMNGIETMLQRLDNCRNCKP